MDQRPNRFEHSHALDQFINYSLCLFVLWAGVVWLFSFQLNRIAIMSTHCTQSRIHGTIILWCIRRTLTHSEYCFCYLKRRVQRCRQNSIDLQLVEMNARLDGVKTYFLCFLCSQKFMVFILGVFIFIGNMVRVRNLNWVETWNKCYWGSEFNRRRQY